MPRGLVLEDFAQGRSGVRATAAADAGAMGEAQRLEVYEQAYAAGWDDAVRAGSDDASRISADLAAALQDLSFTYHEAHAHVLAAVQPILTEALERLFPAAARAALPALAGERLTDLIQRSAATPVTLLVSAGDRERVETVLPPDPGFPLEVRIEATLAEGQVYLSAGTIEEEIDLPRTLDEIAAAITEHFAAPRTDNSNEDRMAAHG